MFSLLGGRVGIPIGFSSLLDNLLYGIVEENIMDWRQLYRQLSKYNFKPHLIMLQPLSTCGQ